MKSPAIVLSLSAKRAARAFKPKTAHLLSFAFFLSGFSIASAELPPDLPGEELSQEYLNWAVPKDTAKKAVDSTAPEPGFEWLDKAQKTWDAPPMTEQLSGDETFVSMGKGGIFVPRLTTSQNEPDIDILDSSRKTVTSGSPGHTFSVEPGRYFVVLGSGGHNQRIVRKVSVEEGKTVSIIPDWAALTIETVDSIATPFRGEYELVRIDEFEPYGRGYGARPDLGEVVKTWIIKPGVYKVLGVGQGYNSLINFVTVRLIPGELTKLLVVQDSINFKILGGGTVEMTPRTEISSHWKYGANIGGSLNFNSEVDRIAKDSTMTTIFSILSSLWITFQKSPYEWQTRIRLNEGLSLTGHKSEDLLTNADDFLFNSLFIWRFLPWLGPYGLAELRTSFFPQQIVRNEPSKYFMALNGDSTLSLSQKVDSSNTFRVKPSFSPLLLDIGVGANADVFSYTYFELKLRAGAGSSYSYFPKQYRTVSTTDAHWPAGIPPDSVVNQNLAKSTVLVPVPASSNFGFGPQTSISGMVRISRFITADGELKIFAPIAPEQRLMRPDFDLLTNVSWRIARWVTLDYTYSFLLIQPKEIASRYDKSTHGVWLRFSYSSR